MKRCNEKVIKFRFLIFFFRIFRGVFIILFSIVLNFLEIDLELKMYDLIYLLCFIYRILIEFNLYIDFIFVLYSV